MDFSKLGGLVPAVVQDAERHDVLMVGFMNGEALARTRETGYVTFFSRSRNTLWTKGETSGNRLAVVSIAADCDDDSLLIRVRCQGAGLVCHTGRRSCFVEDPKVAAFGIIGMTMWTYHWFDPARGGAAEVGETYAQMLLGGLRK